MKTRDEHLSASDRLGDLLDHPAFAGFARLMLPWDRRAYDRNMRLRDLASLMPYHSHVDPDVVVVALNHMIDDVAAGSSVFYDLYTEAQKQTVPTKKDTGLFFFRGQPKAPFAVIAPGGGFQYVASIHEGFPYATQIVEHGFNAFVLKYRVADGGNLATEDMAAAVSFIFRNAKTLGVGTQNYSLWGSSAGARMAAFIGSHGVAAFGGEALPKPSAVVMAYSGHSDYSADEPPTFVAVGSRDGIAPPSVMERRVSALRKQGTAVELHTFPNVGHGFGAGTGTSAEGWITSAIQFWKKTMRHGETSRHHRSSHA